MKKLILIFAVIQIFLSAITHEIMADGISETSSLLVSTEWLAKRLNDPSLILLHIGSKPDYEKGHIPGAQLFSVRAIMEASINGMDHEIPSITKLDSIFESAGINNNSKIVICYSNEMAATWVGRVYVTFDYAGMGDKTSVLDGGLLKWQAENRPITSEIPEISTAKFTAQLNKNVIVTTEWVKENLINPQVVIIDTRPEEAYIGRQEDGRFPRHGHITGAFNLPVTDLTIETTPFTFKDSKTMAEIFLNSGATPGSTVVTYCNTGVWAGLVYFVAKYLGYDVRLYDGSFQAWSANESLPVTGPVQKKSSQ